MAFRVVLTTILISPIIVGFLLAPKADDMPSPPELAAPPAVTSLPDAVRRFLPAGDVQSQSTIQPQATPVSTGG